MEEKKTKWGLFFLILLLTGAVFSLLIVGSRKLRHAPVNHNLSVAGEGILDYDTSHYLSEQDAFVSDFISLYESDFPNPQSRTDGWEKHLSQMKYRLESMEKLNVATPFINYKKEIGSYYTDMITNLDNIARAGIAETDTLSDMYLELEDFSDRMFDELPALLDELHIDYTMEEDKEGNRLIQYYYAR